MADFILFVVHKSRYRWKRETMLILIAQIFTITLCISGIVANKPTCNSDTCLNGVCVDNRTRCDCEDGWWGQQCSNCRGRVRLSGESGYIIESTGNYSVDNKCIWLIETNTSSSIRFKMNQFATECGWDHLYIFDGDSVYAPLIAAYSGLLLKDVQYDNNLPEIVTTSGTAYLYFYSDAAYDMSGFNITYSTHACPKNCSGHGTCNGTVCLCEPEWMGDGCHIPLCPNNCSNNGNCEDGLCRCTSNYKGMDCSLSVDDESWREISTNNTPYGRASATADVVDDYLWVAGGYSFGTDTDFLVRYSFLNRTWEAIKPDSTDNPEILYGHSMVSFKNQLFIYGGLSYTTIQSTLWIFNITSNSWTKMPFHHKDALVGHSAVVINSTMYLMFGHSPIYGYRNLVHEVDLEDLAWSTPETNGALVKGGYGHSSVYDKHRDEIYVYGGYHAGSTTDYHLRDYLYSYNPSMKTWKILRRSGSPRYLHTALMLNDLMLVFGGNTHNDSSVSHGAKCYSPDFLAYNPECNTWTNLKSADFIDMGARYGHTATLHTDSDMVAKMYIFGGFAGIVLNDLLEYWPGSCSLYKNQSQCLEATPGRECAWLVDNTSKCLDKSTVSFAGGVVHRRKCDPKEGADKICPMFSNVKSGGCATCLSTSFDCKWCSNNCSAHCSSEKKYPVTSISECPLMYRSGCEIVNNCEACVEQLDCEWSHDKNCSFQEQYNTEQPITENPACPVPCYQHTSCENCTTHQCMWCGSLERCVETNSYVASFLYGQCMEWTTGEHKCPSTRCSDLYTCEECKMNPSCGWCNDASKTGLGMCVPGTSTAPIRKNDTQPDPALCPSERWHFIDCPECQCNGHSSCTNASAPTMCDECRNLTQGDQCQQCKPGYYGNPKNGGNCTACQCNGQADFCDQQTGDCHCRTRGVVGSNCSRCDGTNNYNGDPNNGGTCYYDLRTDYQFTFNLSKTDDKYYTQIHFMNIPSAGDRDVDFTVNCSGNALLNITYRSNSHPEERVIVSNYHCTYFRAKFEHKDYSFGAEENTTFLVYVYGFTTPFWLQISFSQFPKIDLVHFFVTFFSCFLSLLIIAAVLYKIKHKYDSYRRRQRMIVEMEEMASRPFSSITLEVDRKYDTIGAEKKDTIPTDLRKRKRVSNKPGQIALEPLHNQKAAVLSLFVQLPTGLEDWTPSGQSGLAIASALVTLGHQRKQSIEHGKTDKTKHKKNPFSTHSDTCV